MDNYISPWIDVVVISSSGVLCSSSNLEDPNENPEIDW